jgi:hypothetical protein
MYKKEHCSEVRAGLDKCKCQDVFGKEKRKEIDSVGRIKNFGARRVNVRVTINLL